MAPDIPEEKLSAIMDIVKELVIDNGIPQFLLYTEITKRLREHCTEKEYVLYNTSYGGFGLTKQFKRFAKLNDKYDHNLRTGMYEPIKAFGKHMAQVYPVLLDMVYIYHMTDLSDKFSECRSYEYNIRTLHTITENIKILLNMRNEHGGESHLHEQWKRSGASWMYMINTSNLKSDDLIDADLTRSHTYTLNEVIHYAEEQMACYQKKVATLTPNVDDACLKTISYKFPEEIENDALKWYERKKWGENMCFMKALEQHGVEHFITWKCQSILDETHMRHIMIHNLHKAPQRSDTNDEKIERCYVTIGLLCASDKYASLDFAKVPKGLSWSIGEYDGKEHVYVD